MSIIYDALKKVESRFKENGRDLNTAAMPARQQKKIILPRAYLLYAAIILLGFSSANFFYRFLLSRSMPPPAPPVIPKQALPTATQNLTPVDKLKEQTAAPEKDKLLTPVPTADPALTLNGIFFSGKDGYALINNRILKEGDQIAGLKIGKITSEAVELSSENTTRKLMLNAR